MKLSLTIFLFYFTSLSLSAQNLFVNPGFEELNTCTELHQKCSPEGWFKIRPVKPVYIQYESAPRAFSGGELLVVPVENIYKPVAGRSFIYTMFCCPLEKDMLYKLSFYINTAGRQFYGIDLCMRNKEFISDSASIELLKPSMHISDEDVTMKYRGWQLVETIYKAKGDERFCLIGNLSKDAFHYPPAYGMNRAGDVFYFIDDISFAPVKPTPLCAAFEANKQKIYGQDLRHTEGAMIESEPAADQIVTDTVVVPGVYFETDKSVLKPVFKKLIDSLAAKLADKSIQQIFIEGHTDSRGTVEKNERLSKDRSESVLKYFTQKMPGLQGKIFAEGKGELFPRADNATEKGRAINRRVEIILSYSEKK